MSLLANRRRGQSADWPPFVAAADGVDALDIAPKFREIVATAL
jgi:hypothetical protein